jgi:hypothetical protein
MHAMVDFIICLRHLDGPVVPLIACTLAPDVNPGRLSKMADLPKFIGPLVAHSLIELRLQVGLSPRYSRSLAESCESALHSPAFPGSCRCGSASFRAAPYSTRSISRYLCNIWKQEVNQLVADSGEPRGQRRRHCSTLGFQMFRPTIAQLCTIAELIERQGTRRGHSPRRCSPQGLFKAWRLRCMNAVATEAAQPAPVAPEEPNSRS